MDLKINNIDYVCTENKDSWSCDKKKKTIENFTETCPYNAWYSSTDYRGTVTTTCTSLCDRDWFYEIRNPTDHRYNGCSPCPSGYTSPGGHILSCTQLFCDFTDDIERPNDINSCTTSVDTGTYRKTKTTRPTTTRPKYNNCPPDHYKEDQYNVLIPPGLCRRCPPDHKSPAGSTSESACIGPYTCPANQYNPDRGLTVSSCVPCPRGLKSPSGSFSLAWCSEPYICNANQYNSDEGTRISSCVPCPRGYTSPEGTTSLSGCIGPYSCPANQYNSSAGSTVSSCVPCPTGYTSPAGSTSSSACSAPGTYLCPANQYNSNAGTTSSSCVACGEGLTSPSGSTSASLCIAPVTRPSESTSSPSPTPSQEWFPGISNTVIIGAIVISLIILFMLKKK